MDDAKIKLFREYWLDIQQDFSLNRTSLASTIVRCAALYQACPEPGALGIMEAAFDEWYAKRQAGEIEHE